MRDEFRIYMESVGITSRVIIDRVEEILALAVDTGLMSQVDDIYVSECRRIGDDSRAWEHLLLFSADRMLVAERFLTEDIFRVVLMRDLEELEMKAQDYALKGKATVKSKLTVRVRAKGDKPLVDGTAMRENCDALRAIALKYWVPGARQ